jgi:hypothetical protein
LPGTRILTWVEDTGLAARLPAGRGKGGVPLWQVTRVALD